MSDPQPEAMPGGLLCLLQQAQEQITASYQAFIATEAGLEAKVFKEYHAAGRACLAHLDLVLRLTRGGAPEGAGPAPDLQLLERARLALSRQRTAHTDDEDDECP